MVNWRALEVAVDKQIGSTFGESVYHAPMKSGKADSSRTASTLNAVLHTPNQEGVVSLGAGIVTTLSASESKLVVNRSEYPSVAFAQGDRIRANDRASTPIWEVKSVNSRYSHIIVLSLNQV